MVNKFSLNGKTALITGASRGIGKEIALTLNKFGANVSICDIDKTGLEKTFSELEGKNLCQVVDLSNPNNISDIVNKTINTFGKIDILVNNAGIYKPCSFTEISMDLFETIYKVNLRAVFLLMKECIPHMQQNQWGRIINIASISGKIGRKFNGAYAASKHGVLGLTRVASAEYADQGITVNAICPGVVDTQIVEETKKDSAKLYGLNENDMYQATVNAIPIKRLIKPQEVADLALFLASNSASSITGQAYNVSGGMVQY